jgi:hypothetical protein
MGNERLVRSARDDLLHATKGELDKVSSQGRGECFESAWEERAMRQL